MRKTIGTAMLALALATGGSALLGGTALASTGGQGAGWLSAECASGTISNPNTGTCTSTGGTTATNNCVNTTGGSCTSTGTGTTSSGSTSGSTGGTVTNNCTSKLTYDSASKTYKWVRSCG